MRKIFRSPGAVGKIGRLLTSLRAPVVVVVPGGGDAALLETGDTILLENGDRLLLE